MTWLWIYLLTIGTCMIYLFIFCIVHNRIEEMLAYSFILLTLLFHIISYSQLHSSCLPDQHICSKCHNFQYCSLSKTFCASLSVIKFHVKYFLMHDILIQVKVKLLPLSLMKVAWRGRKRENSWKMSALHFLRLISSIDQINKILF